MIMQICQSSITCTDSVKTLGAYLDSELHSHNQVNCIFLRCFIYLGLVCSIISTFTYLEYMCIYFALVIFKLEYAYAVWNSITSADANKTRIRSTEVCSMFQSFRSSSPQELCSCLGTVKMADLTKEEVSPRCTASYSDSY
jgi:hypothetical protein